MAEKLTAAEARDLARCEKVIEGGLATFQKVGAALLEIRERRLYRAEHSTFETYCVQRWGFSGRRGRQLIAALKKVGEIEEKSGTNGSAFVHLNERQARALSGVDAEQAGDVLEEAGLDASAATLTDIVERRLQSVQNEEKKLRGQRSSLERPQRDRIKAIRGKIEGAIKLIDGSVAMADALEAKLNEALGILDGESIVEQMGQAAERLARAA